MNIYTNTHYEPLTPQTLPFDTYPSQTLPSGKTINQVMSSTANVLMNTPQTSLTYSSSSINQPSSSSSSSSSSTLVNLLHQRRPVLLDQSVTQEKQKTSGRQTRKSPQKKPVTKRLTSVNNDIQVYLIQKKLYF